MPRRDVVTVFCCGTNFNRDIQEEAVADMYRWCDGRKWINDGPGGADITKVEHLFQEGQEPSWWQRVRGTGPYQADSTFMKLRGTLGGRGTQDNILVTLQWLWLEYHRERFSICNLTGWSRGAVTCIAIANAMQQAGFAGLGVRVNVFAYDPVPGGSNDFGVSGTFAETGRAGIDHLAPIVNDFHSILMENVGGAKGLVFKCISPSETSRETHKREYPLPGAHGDCVRWAKPNNPAGKLGLSLGMEFLIQHGTSFALAATDHCLTQEDMLEEYSALRLLQLNDGAPMSRDIAWARSGTIVNQWRHNIYFINGHHFEMFQLAASELYLAAATSKVVSGDLAYRLRKRLPFMVQALAQLNVYRGSQHGSFLPEREIAYEIEVAPGQDAIAKAVNSLQRALAEVRPSPPADASRIWTLDEWSQASKVLIGSRRDQVAAIDVLLPRYHHAAGLNRVGQFRLLLRISELIANHLSLKKTSDRRSAMAQLGHQVLNALQNPPTRGV